MPVHVSGEYGHFFVKGVFMKINITIYHEPFYAKIELTPEGSLDNDHLKQLLNLKDVTLLKEGYGKRKLTMIIE